MRAARKAIREQFGRTEKSFILLLTVRIVASFFFFFAPLPLVFFCFFNLKPLSFSLGLPSVYSSEEDEEETEMYEHDYDGSLAKTGKRHLGKTRWTREEVQILKQASQNVWGCVSQTTNPSILIASCYYEGHYNSFTLSM